RGGEGEQARPVQAAHAVRQGAQGGGVRLSAAAGRPLDLAALARSAAGAPIEVPGAGFSVQLLAAQLIRPAAAGALLLLLEGKLIVDLPAGEFRVLDPHDLIALPAATEVSLKPVASQAVVAWLTPR